MKKYKYVIVSPRIETGGVVVLHALCKCLCELGMDAKIFYPGKFYMYKDSKIKYWIYFVMYTIKDIIRNICVKTFGKKLVKEFVELPFECKRKILPFVSKNTIVVYPEIIFGNPLHGKKVVRWLLFYNSLYSAKNGKTIGYDKDDLFFCYRDVFNDEKLNPEGRKLTITYFNLDTYKRTNFGKREGKCYIVRKGAGRNDLPKEFDGPVVDDLSEKEKVEIFNKCEYCISYDTQTAYSKIAAMCGCVSIVVPEDGKKRSDYRGKNDYDYGEAFGFDEKEIEYAKETAPLIEPFYKENNCSSKVKVEKFILEVEKYFSGI